MVKIEETNIYSNKKKDAHQEIFCLHSSVASVANPSSYEYASEDPSEKDVDATYVVDQKGANTDEEQAIKEATDGALTSFSLSHLFSLLAIKLYFSGMLSYFGPLGQ